MKSYAKHEIDLLSLDETLDFGARLGSLLRGGEIIELVSDLGGGKTAMVRGMAVGIGSKDQVMSPTFTISRIYHGSNIRLHHFDFYRLKEPGVIAAELAESIAEPEVSVAIEWSDIIRDVLPEDRLQITINVSGNDSRHILCSASGPRHAKLLGELA